ncbi:MAG: delta(24)-sterol reductase [Myxococcaceae bacterium]|nr:delta(24)-sterol reductase [Myxococcaceae bacterium]
MSLQNAAIPSSLKARAQRLVERAKDSRASARQRAPADLRDQLTELLIEHRWAIVVPLILPVSKAYNLYWTARHVYYRNLRNAASRHDARVQSVVEQLAAWRRAGKPGLLHTSRKSWQSVAVRNIEYKKDSPSGIDVELHDVLELDPVRSVVRVEPRVNMGQLTRWLAPRGFTVPVVAELDDLTVGGLILGYGIESSAHKYGLFADTVVSAEVVLADGRVVHASATENADLFHALPWSYGAHGFLTAVELRVIPSKPYVRLTYEPVQGLARSVQRFRELAEAADPPEFLEQLYFDLDRSVLVYGDFAELPKGARPNRIGRFWKPWFYKHIESHLTKGKATEYVPLREYYHRYTRSLYWHGELLVPFGNHPLFRYTLGWLMPPKVSLMRLSQTERVRKYRDERNVVQDALVPIRLLRDCIEMFHREFECYPLWMCAHKTFRTEPRGMIGPSDPTLEQEMFVDVGAWQVPRMVKRKEAWNGIEAVKRMEAWLREHRGYQCLYAVTEQTRAQFWQMFDRTLYEQVREKYGAQGAFMDVFDKVKRPGQD